MAVPRRTSDGFSARTFRTTVTNLSSPPRPVGTCGRAPTGTSGSRKYLLASLDQSLRRLGVDYVDIFYHHHFDPQTPLEESLGALHTAVISGKALYVGISSYSDKRTAEAVAILRGWVLHC